MQDVQSGPAEVAMPIDRVGVKDLCLPLVVKDRSAGRQHTVAQVDVSVDLPASFKGTHMSRFVEALEHWQGGLDLASFKTLLADVRERLSATRAHVVLRFPYFLSQAAPASGATGRMSYGCLLDGVLDDSGLTLTLGVEVPVMTVCPCSLAICEAGAHSQRSLVRIKARFSGFVWIEELIDIARNSGSSPVYTLLKREDERHVVEHAFANPAFVEDVVRNAAQKLAQHPRLTWFRVEVESLESIHNHSAFATIEQTCHKG